MSISWYPLAAAEPIPGDPSVVTAGGNHYHDVAVAIEGAAAKLRTIVELDAMTSDAVAAIREKATAVGTEISAARERYATVSAALLTYAASLATAQAAALDLLRRAKTAQECADTADTACYQANAALDVAAPEEVEARQADVRGARAVVTSTAAVLVSLQGDLAVVISDRDTAARVAIDAIGAVVSDSKLNDGWWEDWGSKAAHIISDVAGAISAAAGILAMIVAWVPFIGPAVGAVLGAVALISGIIALVADIALLIAGEGDWLSVGLGVLSLVTFGVGRAAGTGLKVSSQAAKGRAFVRGTQVAQRARNPATTVQSLLGNDIAQLTMREAKDAGRALSRTGDFVDALKTSVTPGAIVGDLAGDIRAGVTAVARPEVHGLWRSILAGTGHAEAAGTLQQLAGISGQVTSPSLTHALNVAKWTGGVAVGATTTGVGLDSYSLGSAVVEYFSDAPSAAQQLNLVR